MSTYPQENARSSRLTALQFGLFLAGLLFLTLLLYTFAHEGGHALVGLLFGGQINGFSINFFDLSAHVGLDGDFTPLEHSLISAAGVSLPLLLAMLYLLLSPKQDAPVLTWFKLIALAATINSLLAWVVIPVLVALGNRVGDDSANFVGYSKLPPLAVSGAALLVYLGCGALALRRMGGLASLAARLRSTDLELGQPRTRRALSTLASLGVIVLAGALALSLGFPERPFQVPAGYQLHADLDLSQRAFQGENVYQFSLSQPSQVGFYVYMQQVKGGPVEVLLTGPGGYKNSLLNLADPKTDIGRGSVKPPPFDLAIGDYEVRITLPQSGGRVQIYTQVQ